MNAPLMCEHRGCAQPPIHKCETCKCSWCDSHADMRGRKCGAPDCKGGCEGFDCAECADLNMEASRP